MNGFSESDYVNYRYLVHSNLVDSMVQLVRAADEFELKPDECVMVIGAVYKKIIFSRANTNFLKFTVDKYE